VAQARSSNGCANLERFIAKRKFQTKLKDTGSRPVLGMFPRKLGRRMDYDGGPNQKVFEEPEGTYHNGSLRDYHGNLKGPGKLCGGDNAPKLVPATHPRASTINGLPCS
jgi:hypothetical protein